MLLNDGYWSEKYWPFSYWNALYWPGYAAEAGDGEDITCLMYLSALDASPSCSFVMQGASITTVETAPRMEFSECQQPS